MIVFDSIEDILIPPTATPLHLAVGTFDGVHLAHAALLRGAREQAHASGGAVAVLTFRNHPRSVVQPENAPPGLLTPWPLKARLLERLGIDYAAAIDFTPALAATSPEDFVLEVLLGRCRASSIHSGRGFHFGKGGRGGPGLLAEMAESHGFTYQCIDPVDVDGEIASSTLVRRYLDEGRVAKAATVLGRPHQIGASVVKGDGLGHQIGFPTANLKVSEEVLLPSDGVYAVAAYIDDENCAYPAMMNIGWRPTIGGKEHRTEVHLLDFDKNLLGSNVTIQFLERLRGEIKFGSLEELTEQLEQDKEVSQKTLEGRSFERI